MDNFEITLDVMFKYFSGQVSEKEIEAILNWLEESNSNRKEFARAKKLFIETTNYFSNSDEKQRLAFQNFEKHIDSKETLQKSNSKVVSLKLLLRYAALFLLLLGFGYTAYYWGRSNKSVVAGKNNFYVVDVPYGGKSSLTLPDGSTIHLNAGSKLRYSKDFGINSRELHLDGEGLFEVEKHKFPMVVHTSHIDIKVLGTVFNVKSYNEEDIIETTLLEGSIRIEAKDKKDDNVIQLRPNQKLVYNKNELNITVDQSSDKNELDKTEVARKVEKPLPKIYKIKSNVDVSASVAWKEGKYIFTGETLEELAVILTRKFDVTFSFENEEVKSHTYSGTLGDYPIEQVLEALSLTSPVVYNIKEKQVYLALDKEKLNTYNKLIND